MSEHLTKDAIDLSTLSIPRLFGRYFLPTLFGMLSISAMCAIDGIFVGHAVEADGIGCRLRVLHRQPHVHRLLPEC